MQSKHDKKFELLDQLLVSSPGEGGITYFNGIEQSIISIRPTTGLVVDGNRIIFAYQDNGGNILRVVDKEKSKNIELSSGMLDLHDVYFYQDTIYVVATENNEVIHYDKNFKVINRWKLIGEHDSAHINSITIYNGRLIASIFGRFNFNREYKKDTKGRGQVIDVITGNTVIDGLSQPHSLRVANNLLYLCNSEEKELHIYEGFKLKFKMSFSGYTRGIGFGNKKIYVGISSSRNIDRNGEKPDFGYIAVIDNVSMKVENTISIPFREIYDITVVTNNLDKVFYEERDNQFLECVNLRRSNEKKIIRYMDRINYMTNSRSWRITSPLRSVVDFFYKRFLWKI